MSTPGCPVIIPSDDSRLLETHDILSTFLISAKLFWILGVRIVESWEGSCDGTGMLLQEQLIGKWEFVGEGWS